MAAQDVLQTALKQMDTLKTSPEANYDRRIDTGQTDRKNDLKGHELTLCPKTEGEYAFFGGIKLASH